MITEAPPPMSPNVVQATGQVASDVVGGLKQQPMMLTIVVLNVIGIGIAGYIGIKFLDIARAGSESNREMMREIIHDSQVSLAQMMEICFGAPKGTFTIREERKGSPEYGGPR